jgi:hypothetical protein
MFKIKPVSSNAMTTPKSPKTNNVPINVVVVVTTHNQQSGQQVFKERESVKIKGAKEWQQKEHL